MKQSIRKAFMYRALTNLGLTVGLSALSACMVFPLDQTDPERHLNWCPPLPNCASTKASTAVHSIQPFKLKTDVETAWPTIRESVSKLEGTHIVHEHPGYIYAKSYSRVFHFLDYFEVLAIPERNELEVRSSSLLGISDLGVNYFRTEEFRKQLEAAGLIVIND